MPETQPVESRLKYTCFNPDCHYCELMKKRMSSSIPILPLPYMADITRAGGWFEYRDAVIAENLKPNDFHEIKKMKQRENYRLSKKIRLGLAS